jgi:mycofactocin system FadH/OYE family oxidoreductase 2
MKNHYSALFEPLYLKGLLIPNRIVFASHRTNFAVNNLPSQRHIDYYRERARGGVGLIIIEEGIVHPSDYPYERAIFAYEPAVVEKYATVAEEMHLQGAKVFGCLNHWGSQGTGLLHKKEIWGPSPLAATGEIPKKMELEDIDAVIKGFALSAGHLKEAGLDGVEVNAGQHSLIRQFLSPLTNLRSDHYGGNMENRVRFCRQVLEAVRRKVGEGFVVGLRLTMDEYAPWAGITPEMGLEIASYLESTEVLDYLSVSVGSIYTLHMTSPSMAIPPGFTLPYGEKLKEAVRLPVMVGGRISEGSVALKALNEGQADLIEMTRALIADPNVAFKIRRNLVGEIKPCLACNQGCKLDGFLNKQLKCTVNSEAGRERELRPKLNMKVKKGKKVAIVGSGPAGMEAALQAALRGYEAHLFEKESLPGGNMLLAGKVPGREGIGKLISYYTGMLNSLGVQLHFNCEITGDTDFSAYHALIVATGSRDRIPEIPGVHGLQLLSGKEVWRGAEVGERVLLVDEDGFHPATGIIELLAQKDKAVFVVTSEMFVGYKLTETQELTFWNQRVKGKKVTFIPHHRVKEINGKTVTLEERYSGVPRIVDDLNTVIFCYPRLPREDLYLQLKEKFGRIYRIGDCVAPRTIANAVYEGYKAGKSV